MLSVNPKPEVDKIIAFLQRIAMRTGMKNMVIGWSGGIDSSVCLCLLARALPPQNIYVLHMPYGHSIINELTLRHSSGQADSKINGLKIPEKNIHEISIKKAVDNLWKTVNGDYSLDPRLRGDDKEGCGNDPTSTRLRGASIGEKIRLGNIMARVRMIMLFDFAKKVKGLVCGTENKTEHLLGYFTRYGDGASDLEPIQHLFKTQVFELAKYLGVPDSIIKKPPSANLWEGQTDEGEFGFTYEEADEVLGRIRDIRDIGEIGGKKDEKILERVRKNKFKQEVPYTLKI